MLKMISSWIRWRNYPKEKSQSEKEQSEVLTLSKLPNQKSRAIDTGKLIKNAGNKIKGILTTLKNFKNFEKGLVGYEKYFINNL